MLDETQQFTLVRDLPGTPEQVFRAWTDPDQMAGWLAGMNASRESISADPRVGGRYAYTMVDDETGDTFPTGGQYLELDEPSRLVMSWGDPADSPRLEIDLEPSGTGTRMTFVCIGIAGQPGDNNVYDGWDEALGYLADALDGSGPGQQGRATR